MKTSKIIQDIGDKYSLKGISYIAKRKGKDTFLIGYIDEDGEAVPTGLPTIYLTGGKTVEVIGGRKSLELL